MTNQHSETMRAPHLATAEVIAYAGQPAAQRLLAMFDTLNIKHFDSELGDPLVLILQTQSARTLGDYCPRDVHGLESRIRLAPHVIAKGQRFADDVLLHEMVHAWQHEIAEDGEEGYRGHGPVFARKCNEIGTDLGLPPVGVKGRDGLPDCKSWPMNVRPAGYYGADFKAPTRKPKKQQAKKPAGESEGGESGEGKRDWRLMLAMMEQDELDLLSRCLEIELDKRDAEKQAELDEQAELEAEEYAELEAELEATSVHAWGRS
jgi:hypothetical protein